MTLKQLEAFYWAATCRNFAVAAERVHLSLSSLSKRVAELEASLGVPLFDRSGRSAELTPQGEQLLPRIRAFLGTAAQLQQFAGHSQGLHGRCRVGVGELSGATWLPKLARLVGERHPGLQLEPQVDIGQVLERRIEDGELDCGVVAGASAGCRLASELVAEVRFVWIASPAFIAQAGTDLPQQLLRSHTLIALPSGAGSTRMLDQWLARHEVTVQRQLTCNSWAATFGMVVQGVGFAFMPEQWAQALQARGVLQILHGGGAMAPLQYIVQWRADDTRPLITELRSLIRSVVDFSPPHYMF